LNKPTTSDREQTSEPAGPYGELGSGPEPHDIPVNAGNLSAYAFFFDMDGTLAPIAATPGAAHVPPQTKAAVERLVTLSGGAVAVVSGRPLDQIDALLAPLSLPGAGLHGAQWRAVDGRLVQLGVDPAPVARMVERLRPLHDRHPGVLLEDKGISLAVHYRNAPHCESLVVHETSAAIAPYTDTFVLQPGKMVVEIKPRAASKAGAIERMMTRPPFLDRIALFAGDDLTDEAGFQAVNERNGVSIKVGEGPTAARWRFATPAALARWLASLCVA
jgi:trehalose 6-phosphate phosphatase